MTAAQTQLRVIDEEAALAIADVVSAATSVSLWAMREWNDSDKVKAWNLMGHANAFVNQLDELRYERDR